MYHTTQALQMNSSYMQQERHREAANERMARSFEKAASAAQPFSFSQFQRRMVAVAVALVTVLGVIALF